MNYKLFLYILFILFLNSCIETTDINYSTKPVRIEKFSNKGFALIYDDNLFKKKIINKKKVVFFKKYLENFNQNKINDNTLVAIITPDADIVENADKLYPAYMVFKNYELILKWNRSLRFGIAVCTLKDKFKNEL